MSQSKPTDGAPADDLSGETVLNAPAFPPTEEDPRPQEPAEATGGDPQLETVLHAPVLPASRAAQRSDSKRRAAGEPPTEAMAPPTVMFDGAAARQREGLEGDDDSTAPRGLAGNDRPTASRRPLAALVDDADRRSEVSEAPPAEHTFLGERAKKGKGIQLVVAAFMLLLAVGLGAKLWLSRTETPSTLNLRLLYPFGVGGGRLPNGRRAPGCGEVVFKLTKTFDCDGDRCLTYTAHTPDGSFKYPFTVRKDDDLGAWVLATHAGSP